MDPLERLLFDALSFDQDFYFRLVRAGFTHAEAIECMRVIGEAEYRKRRGDNE